jgi:hypothetical protein
MPTDPWAPGGGLFDLWWNSVFNIVSTTAQVAQQVQQVGQQAFNWLGSRDPNCALQGMVRGGAVGMAGGATVGLAGGPAAELTVPAFSLAGSVGGAAVGGVGGLITCSSKGPSQGGGGGGQSRSTAGNMQKQVERGQAPKSVDRVDRARFPFEKDQVHFKGGHALNYDGTWEHAGRALTNGETGWLINNGWSLPK